LTPENELRGSENRVLRKMFGPERKKVAGGCRTLQNEELHNLYASSDTFRLINSRRMWWAGHVARLRAVRIVKKRKLVGKSEKTTQKT
jgi:hypothetical protein